MSIKTFRVRPVPGRRVKDPSTLALLQPAGELKPRTSYWLRRLADGDVEEVPEEQPANTTKTARKPRSDA